MGIENFVASVPSMNAGEVGYVVGYAGEKVLEAFVTKRVGNFTAAASRGEAVLGSSIGPLRQWVRTGDTFSRTGQFQTVGVKWGASPINGGRFIRQIGNPRLQQLNQSLRGMKLPGNSWRTADPGHLHLWRR